MHCCFNYIMVMFYLHLIVNIVNKLLCLIDKSLIVNF